MPRLKLSKEEYKLRRNAAEKKWERKVGIRQGSPPPIVLTHRPVTRSQSVETQLVIYTQPRLEPASTHTLSTPVLPLSKAPLDAVAELRAELEE